MNILKGQYEISIWEDIIMYVGVPKSGKTSPTENISDLSSVTYQYYSERRLAIIGSDTMTSPARVINPVLTRNINGVYTLKFDMFYQYEDIETGKIERNPLIDLVIDERKIKLYYPDGGDDQPDHWYDFIVKKDEEKGRENKYSFICNGLAANELGKTGFNVELDIELKNNTGTVQELGQIILKDSDWQLAQNGQQVIQQTNDEALYNVILTSSITSAKKLDGSSFGTIPTGARIYVYYTPWANQEKNYFQFIYVNNDTGTLIPDLLEDKVTINCNNTRTYDLYVTNVTWANDKPNFATGQPSVSQYRGHRYVRKQLMDYDPVLEQTVYKYTKNNTIYYGYTTTEYISATSVINYIHNSINFANTSYWNVGNGSVIAKVYPDVSANNINGDFKNYLIVNFTNTNGYLVNDGIIYNYNRINNFEKGQVYRLKIKVKYNNSYLSSLPFNCKIEKYELIDSSNNRTTYFNFNNTSSTSNNYIVINATCINSATWRDLKENVGIFLTPKNSNFINKDYYIEEIQIYRYILDSNGNPLEINSVPDPQVNTIYHFYNPALNAGLASKEDYIFDDNNPNNYTPLFGSGEEEFEKIRSITAKESNRFNLLQQLAETFQCWVKFKIEHDQNGAISIEDYTTYIPSNPTKSQVISGGYYIYDQINNQYISTTTWDNKKQYFKNETRKRQNKKVVFFGEILQDNYVGFKYGINLKDNNRTLDSDQIATKIIVKNNTCEYANNGFCSIARANDNPIKENFALNLDYYTTQGLINASALNNDIYLQINGSIGLYPRLAKLNKNRNDLIEEQALLNNTIDNLMSERQVYQLLYNESTEKLNDLIDERSGRLVQFTGYKYADFGNQYKSGSVTVYPNTIYYIAGALTNISGGTVSYYKLETNNSPQKGRTYYTLSNGKFVSFNNTKFVSGFNYYYSVSAQYGAKTYFQTGKNTKSLTFAGNSSSQVYIYMAARRIMKMGDEDYINDNTTIGIIESIKTLTATRQNAEEQFNKYDESLTKAQTELDSIKSKLSDIAEATKEVEKEFNTKYSRYIQEGSWTDDNYMDDDLYYLDSLSVLYQSAYPKVTYTFTPLDLKFLEGYEDFDFQVAHKTYVEDTEMFGYRIIDNLKTPVREVVVVTELSQNLDDPTKNNIKIQNYKSHFEDLFQRITAATQSLEFHSGEYAKAAEVITPEGAISEDTFQRSLATAAYVIQNSRDQSIVWDDTGLQATKLNDPLQVTRLTSGGLLVSADGGQTWGVAISGYGINTNYLSAGIIDADKINILSGAYPTFKWDANGLRAYGFTKDGNVITSFDPTTFVSFDKFGIYGINGLLNPVFNNISEVEENANFALTWNGLFMRAQHRDGYVRISPTEDITIYESQTNSDVIRAKLGLLNSSGTQDVYGLALYDSNGNSTIETKSDGTLWLKSQMDIGDQSTNQIYVGVGQEATQAEKNKYGNDHGKKVFTVHGVGYTDDTGSSGGNTQIDRFSVYEDGFIVGNGSYISGPINVTEGGQIGNMSVSGLVDTVGVRIEPGNVEFKYNGISSTPTSMNFSVTHGFGNNVTYAWYLYKNASQIDQHQIQGATSNNYTYTFNSTDFENGVTYLKVKVTSGSDVYTDRITLTYVMDGQNGQDAIVYTYSIESSLGNTINTSNLQSSVTTTVITGHVYKIEGNNAPIDITNQITTWEWYEQKNDESAQLISGATTSSFDYSLENWNNVQIYFKATISS